MIRGAQAMGKMIDLLPDPRSPAALLIGIPEESTQHHAGLLSVCGAPATGATVAKDTRVYTLACAHKGRAHIHTHPDNGARRNILKQNLNHKHPGADSNTLSHSDHLHMQSQKTTKTSKTRMVAQTGRLLRIFCMLFETYM